MLFYLISSFVVWDDDVDVKCVSSLVPVAATAGGMNTNPAKGSRLWAAGLAGILSIPASVLPFIILATQPLELFNVMMPNGACKGLARLCVKSSFLGRSAGVGWCLLEVPSHFSNYSLKVCRWGLGISLPLMHNVFPVSYSYRIAKSMCKFLGAVSAVFVFSWCCAVLPLN